MNERKMVDLTEYIVRKYYQNDIQPFMEHIDENILWYGPAKGQFISGREAMVKAWANESHSLIFTLGNVRLDYRASHSSYCEVIMSFPVTIHYPEGECITMDQVLHITWCERKDKEKNAKVPRMLVVHISDLYHKHETDNIYPVNFNKVYRDHITVSDQEERILFRGMDHSNIYVFPSDIIWVENCDYGRHSMLYTIEGDIRVNRSTNDLESSYPDIFVRCHRCYLVNPVHIVKVIRFKVTLTNGDELPIPEKKYTAFKNAVNEFMDKLNAKSDEPVK